MKLSQVEEIFHQALEMADPRERAEFVQRASGNDPLLRQKVLQLLDAHRASAPFLDTAADSSRTGCDPLIAEGPGTVIGRYKLLQVIGEGGMGVVYMADQEEPVRRRVALKIIKLGMDTRQVVARFEAERQALALMDHPNIAKVLDGGATQTGRPYFVMELVRGIPITEFCDRNHLPTRQRLELFITVCQAIQHAHQKGIIHRDLKPSNVLVTLSDGVPQPMVIDFGIAKATHQRLTDKTFFTQFTAMLGTPAYMSPEQAEMSKLDVDTRSDIYSLGVLLYELLTGTAPFPTQELLRLGYAEMQRVILEAEPPRPSTRLSTLERQQRALLAHDRGTEPAALERMFKGDLDWVVMKCLEKDRSRRYETANGLAADLKRHLQDEPVSARPPSFAYRCRKGLRRNKLTVAAATAVGLALVLATVVSAWQARRARRAANVAEMVSRFLLDIFNSPNPNRDGRTITVAETLDRAAKKADNDLAKDPLVRAAVQETLGTTYYSLGLYEQAVALQQQALEYARKFEGAKAQNTLLAMNNLANSLQSANRVDEAMKLQEELLKLLQHLKGPNNLSTIGAMGNLANSYTHKGRQEEALQLRERVLRLSRTNYGPEHSSTLDAMHNLALSYATVGRQAEAIKLLEQVLASRRRILGSDRPDTISSINSLARCYNDVGRTNEALQLQEESVQLSRKVLGPDHPGTFTALDSLAISYQARGRYADAAALFEALLRSATKQRPPDDPVILTRQSELAECYRRAGRARDVIRVLQDLLPRIRNLKGSDAPETLQLMRGLCLARLETEGPQPDILEQLQQVVALSRTVYGPEHAETMAVMVQLVHAYEKAGRTDDVIDLWTQLLALWRKLKGPEDAETLVGMSNLAVAYANKQRFAEALELEKQVADIRTRLFGPEHPLTLEAMENLAACYGLMGQNDQAFEILEQRLTLLRKIHGPDHPECLAALEQIASMQWRLGRNHEALGNYQELLALAVKLHPDSPQAAGGYSNVGFLLDATGHGEEAIRAWEEAVRIEPKMDNTQYWLGRALVDRKRYGEALPALRAAHELYPTGPRSQEVAERLAFAESMLGGKPDESHNEKP